MGCHLNIYTMDIYTMGHCSVITWINLKCIMLNRRIQAWKITYPIMNQNDRSGQKISGCQGLVVVWSGWLQRWVGEMFWVDETSVSGLGVIVTWLYTFITAHRVVLQKVNFSKCKFKKHLKNTKSHKII